MSDAESLGAQDRIPREAVHAAQEAQWALTGEDVVGVEDALRAAYPLIREWVCQELAAALKKHANGGQVSQRDWPRWQDAAEFVESYGGASPGGEHE